MRLFSVFLAIVCLCAAPAAAEGPTMAEKLRSISPGMTRETVLAVLGEPEAIVEKSVDAYGRPLEVWRYLPGLSLPAQSGVATPNGSPVRAAVSVSGAAPSGGTEMDRIRREVAFWQGVNKAGTQNPADPYYKPDFAKPDFSRAPRQAQVHQTASTPEAYLIVFVNGTVQSIRLSQF